MPNDKTVRGHIIEPPRPTKKAFLLAALYLGVPMIGFLLMLDVLLYAIFELVLDRCYGIFCLISSGQTVQPIDMN